VIYGGCDRISGIVGDVLLALEASRRRGAESSASSLGRRTAEV
jgi:hypothetical protein